MIPTLMTKTIAVASLLVAGTIVPQPDAHDTSDALALAATSSQSAPQPTTASHTRSHLIPDPVPVPSSWTAQPIVIDLK